jgi:hypothetical protein
MTAADDDIGGGRWSGWAMEGVKGDAWMQPQLAGAADGGGRRQRKMGMEDSGGGVNILLLFFRSYAGCVRDDGLCGP